jgi:hypothetical protein
MAHARSRLNLPRRGAVRRAIRVSTKIDANRLRCFLGVFGVSIAELAHEAHVDRSYVSKAFSGNVKLTPRLLKGLSMAIEKIARGGRVDSSSLLVGESE